MNCATIASVLAMRHSLLMDRTDLGVLIIVDESYRMARGFARGPGKVSPWSQQRLV
jgi:hypothetical protein